MDLKSFAGFLGATGQSLIDLDENKVGWEDFTGSLLVYGAEVITAVSDGMDLPELPEILRRGTTEKITGAFRATLQVANGVLAYARFQFSGKAAIALKYVNQTISQLLAGAAVPTAPTALLS
jgi:hypothetical protein